MNVDEGAALPNLGFEIREGGSFVFPPPAGAGGPGLIKILFEVAASVLL
jgi:hypothetical protein